MIVGLGDCCMLEENFALRETFSTCGSSPPIGFDGWKLRHWTNQFKGERFSFDLVWFRAQKLDYLFRWHSAQLFSRYTTVRTSTRERERVSLENTRRQGAEDEPSSWLIIIVQHLLDSTSQPNSTWAIQRRLDQRQTAGRDLRPCFSTNITVALLCRLLV
jgi:hypothetical protein